LSLGDQSPLFCYLKLSMIDKTKIEMLVLESVKGTGIFLVDIKTGRSEKISVFVDNEKGITLEECASLHRKLEKMLESEAADFELQVSSPGLSLPFRVIEQYYKNIGKKVRVIDNEGKRSEGILKNVTKGGFELEIEVREKGKKAELKEISFNFDQVKSTREIVTIK
jgi:ribosome maturation factor RimP